MKLSDIIEIKKVAHSYYTKTKKQIGEIPAKCQVWISIDKSNRKASIISINSLKQPVGNPVTVQFTSI